MEENITSKGRVDNKTLAESEKEFKVADNKEYKVKTIINSAIYGQQINNNQIPGLYYLSFCGKTTSYKATYK